MGGIVRIGAPSCGEVGAYCSGRPFRHRSDGVLMPPLGPQPMLCAMTIDDAATGRVPR